MPELPEVETVARGLVQHALHRRIAEVIVHHPGVVVGPVEDFASHLSGRTLVSLRRIGKVISVELDAVDGAPPRYLVVRLGMTGQLTVQPVNAPLEPHTHVRLALDEGREEIRYRDPRRFGSLRCLSQEELDALFKRLGPDAQQVTEAEFFVATRGRHGALKSWLMNQNLLAGMGNIYADEALFAARLHPLTQPGRLSRESVRRLHRAVRQVLDRAVKLQGTSFRDYLDIEGRPGNFLSRLKVYGREGEPCRRCKTKIRRIVVAGRSSHFCPRCQTRPRRTAASTRAFKTRMRTRN
jgi:formamidopyrimidine-DNA glycosylase